MIREPVFWRARVALVLYVIMRIGLLQLNPVIGDINGNADRIISAIRSMDADIIVTPEMSICGYPPTWLHTAIVMHCSFASCKEYCTCDSLLPVTNGDALGEIIISHPFERSSPKGLFA